MILLLAANDWANVAYSLAESLKSVGKDALALKSKKHRLQYPNQARVYGSSKELKTAVRKAHAIIWMHSSYTNVDTAGKKLLVYHGGSRYRKDPVGVNKFFNRLVHVSLIQTADLLGLGARNEKWLQAPVDTTTLQPNFEKVSEPKTIAHYAAKGSKGTEVIHQVFEKLKSDPALKDKFQFAILRKRVSWGESIERISNCDIFVDAFQPTLHGDRRYGEWGITALEASALGKIVVSHFLRRERYYKDFGKCAIRGISSAEELEQTLRNLIQMSDEQMREEKVKTREWVERKHSFKVIGWSLFKIINNIHL